MKLPLSIVVVSSDGEANALRAVLEGLNYRVDVLWIGSRAEFVKVINGQIETQDRLIFSCHGIKEGIYIPDEKPISPEEISEAANLKNKTILNLGCNTGNEDYRKAFVDNGKANVYIAPGNYPEGNTALMFGIHFFYELANKKTVKEAFDKAKSFDEASKIFKLFE